MPFGEGDREGELPHHRLIRHPVAIRIQILRDWDYHHAYLLSIIEVGRHRKSEEGLPIMGNRDIQAVTAQSATLEVLTRRWTLLFVEPMLSVW